MTESPPQPPTWSARKSRHPKRFVRFLLMPEWVMEWMVFFLRRWALVELLSLVGSFALLTTLVSYCRGSDERLAAHRDARQARQFQAWQVITNAQGKPGNGGRTLALENLAHDSVDLSGVDISGALLEGLELPAANLRNINAKSANLRFADLRGADLRGADLSNADLRDADLRGADMGHARLTDANLQNACLDNASLIEATVVNADLHDASLRGVEALFGNFFRSEFPEAQALDSANFGEAVLDSVSLQDSIPLSADVHGASLMGTGLYSWREPFDQDQDEELVRRGAVRTTGRPDLRSPVPATSSFNHKPWRRIVDELDSIYPRKRDGTNERLVCQLSR